MPDSVRPGQHDPTALSVIATITLDVELVLLDAHACFPRIDTVVRRGDQISVIHGTPAAAPIPVRLPPDFTPIARIYVQPWGQSVWPGQITNLQAGAPDYRKTR